jgi:hypothetical protein
MEENLYNLKENRKNKLSHVIWQKRFFDPSSKQDIAEYRYFLKNHRWKNNCPFILEWPHLMVTDMVRTQLIDYYIEVMAENAE